MSHQLLESERQRVLLADQARALQVEMHHRVRNTLAIVRSVFSRTIETRPALEDLESHFRGRLDALARHQVALAINPDGEGDLENMIRDELRSFEFDERIKLVGPDVRLPKDAIPTFGLALHELTTNAIKFGALSTSDPRCRLLISWTYSENWLLLNWAEAGVQVPTAHVRRGFGREFIEDALPYQLGATTTFNLKPGGLWCSIALQLDDAVLAAADTPNWR